LVPFRTIRDWVPGSRPGVSWDPSLAEPAKVGPAPVSGVPAGRTDIQHLRGFCEQAARGLDYSPLLVVTCDVPGRCDIRAMSYVINTRLHCHDMYRSWFEYTDARRIVRRTSRDPPGYLSLSRLNIAR
jgi:mycolipenoyl-CoA---2-(long-chain-fatty acyl)-trehalose mycolipenoyltransferase / long-chain-acyl-CoA---trehalose acyltransferase